MSPFPLAITIVPRLLPLGAKPGGYEREGPLEQAICTEQPQLIELLLKHQIPMISDDGVCYIAPRGNTVPLQRLIDYELDLSIYGGAALLEAIKAGQFNMTKLLIDNGANPNLEAELLQYPEFSACYSSIEFALHFGRLDILKFLLEMGIPPGRNDLAFLENYPKEIVDVLPKLPETELPPKESLQALAIFGFPLIRLDDLNIKWPLLAYSFADEKAFEKFKERP